MLTDLQYALNQLQCNHGMSKGEMLDRIGRASDAIIRVANEVKEQEQDRNELIADAAEATEKFSEDELEDFAKVAHECQYCDDTFESGGAKMRHEQDEHC